MQCADSYDRLELKLAGRLTIVKASMFSRACPSSLALGAMTLE